MELELNGKVRSSKYGDLRLNIVYDKEFDDYVLCIYNKEIQIDGNLPSNVGDVLSQMNILNNK